MSAIFISHSSNDDQVATELKRLLVGAGYHSLFLDFDPEAGIPPGREWEQELYGQLRSSQAVIVLCSKYSMASMWCFAEITHAKALGKTVFPIKVDDCVVSPILTSRQVLDLTKDKDDAYRRLFAGLKVLGMDSKDTFDWDPKRPPYPGLMAFQEEDAAVFFGREPEMQEVLETLNRLRQFGGARLLMVLGASGSGKSSMIKAGIIPRLRRDPERWLVLSPFRPRENPIKELALVLEEGFKRYDKPRDWQAIVEQLNAPGGGAYESTSALMQQGGDLQAAARKRDATVLLFIDQMEELFTDEKGSGAERVLPLLKGALDKPGSPLMAVGTLRSDFLGEFQVCAREFNFAALSMGPLTTDRLSRVIEGPAEVAGIRLEEGLTEVLREDTGPEALPLLAFALRELADHYATNKVLTLDKYRNQFGGLARSVARAAEAVYGAKKLSAQEEEDLRRAFRSMVRVDQTGVYVGQRANRASLASGVSEILERFVEARLLVAGGEGEERSLEVAHEALFSNWERLRRWLDDDREFLLWRERLRTLLTVWEGTQESEEALLRGPLLIRTQAWADERRHDLSDQELKFISVSREQREKEQQVAQKARDTFTDNFFRIIGVSKDSIPTSHERETLWELAQIDSAFGTVREKLLNRWFLTEEAFKRGNASSGQGFRAALGLNVEYHRLFASNAAKLGRSLVLALENPQKIEFGQRLVLPDTLPAVASKVEPPAAEEIANRLALALENPQQTERIQLSALCDALLPLAGKVGSQAAAKITNRLATALENAQEKDDDRLWYLWRALAVLSKNMEPQPATEIAQRLAAALENSRRTEPRWLLVLADALLALANKLEPHAAAEIASRGYRRLATALENHPTNYEQIWQFTRVLKAMAIKMEPQSATEIAKGVAATLENSQETNPDWVLALVEALGALASKMEPKAAAEIARLSAQRLAAALESPQEAKSHRLSSLGEALAVLANKMEPNAATEIARRLAAALENPQKADSKRVLSLSNALAELANKMEPGAATEIVRLGAQRLAAALVNSQETDSYWLLELSEALAALTNKMEPKAAAEIARLGAQRLAAVLKNSLKADYVLLWRLGRALAALANNIEARAAAEIASGLAAALKNQRETNPDWVLALGEALAALANKMEAKAAAEIAKLGAQRLAATLDAAA